MAKRSVRTRFLIETTGACLLALAVSASVAIGWTTLAGAFRGPIPRDVLVFLVAFGVAGIVGVLRLRRARESVLEPVLQLSFAIQRIVSVGNFRDRVEKPEHKEFSELAEQVNLMLARIEQNDRVVSELKSGRDQQYEARISALQAQLDEQRQTMKDLVLSKAAAEESSLAKSAFLFNMSHELRTPLNAIMGYSELLQEEAGDEGTQAGKDVAKILGAGRHLLTLINAVLDLSKIEAGRLEVQAESFDVSQLLHDVVSTSESLATAQRNTMELTIADGLGSMHSDPTKVRQVLLNLLGNATKFTTDGTITVEAERESHLADWVVIRVKDTGIGMSPDELTGLFREFKQGRTARQRPDRGSGLGLAISQALCQLMGGVIQVESTAGVGSTFTVRLPAQVAKTGRAGALLPRPPAVPSKGNDDPSRPAVVVIDHDAGARELVQRVTSKLGYRLIEATNASDGYRLAVVHEPAAIVLEVVLSGQLGWGLLERLTHMPVLGKLPVIVVSVSDDEARSRSLGAVAHFKKPVPTQQLHLLLKDLAEGSGRQTEQPTSATAPRAAVPVA